MKALKHLPAWKALEAHFKTMRSFDMRAVFREDDSRFDQLSLRCGNLLLDHSKNRVTPETASTRGESSSASSWRRRSAPN